MRKLSRRKRESIGAVVVLAGSDESLTLLGSIPFIAFFAWLCPELWQGK